VNKKRILVIDDDIIVQTTIAMVLRLKGYEVDTAGTGKEAVEKSAANSYNLALIDFRLPDIDGTELLTVLQHPTARMVKIILTGYPSDENRAQAFNKHADGYLVKPVKLEKLLETVNAHLRLQDECEAVSITHERSWQNSEEFYVIAIGASAGGPRALEQVLSTIPSHLPVAFVISQHMPNGFTKSLVARLREVSALNVREASLGDVLRAGDALVAPGGCNMELLRDGRIRLHMTTITPAPSIDVMMTSVAKVYRSQCVGILLTGMLDDGVQGMKAIKEHGGVTIVQDEHSCVVYGMPKAALEAGAVDIVAGISEIPHIIVNTISKTNQRGRSN